MSKPYKGGISDWEIMFYPQYKLAYPDTNGVICRGKPQGHPDFVNWIRTSQVLKINPERTQIETENSIYDLIGPGTITDEARGRLDG